MPDNADIILVKGCKWAATHPSYFCLNGKYFNQAFVVK